MRPFYRLVVLTGLCSAGPAMLLACSKSSESSAAGGAASASTASASPAPPEPAASYSAQTAASVTPSAYMTIPERFNAEVGQRPSGTLRVEEVTAAFRKAGLTIEDEKQHLASTPENDVTAKKPLATSSALKRPALPRRNRQGIR